MEHSPGLSAWSILEESEEYRCPLFSVSRGLAQSSPSRQGRFFYMDAPEWAMVLPLLGTEGGGRFLMVRQWRHGSGEYSLEFPGGVVEAGEEPASGASRELREETGHVAGSIELLGRLSPNPAYQRNNLNVFLARELGPRGKLELDEHEEIELEEWGLAELVSGSGKPPLRNALMLAALALYLAKLRCC